MIRIVIEKGKGGQKGTGLVYFKDGEAYGIAKVLQSLPRKQGQQHYEWEEVKIELE